MHGIDRDKERFRQIVRGRIKKDLKKYISQDNIEIAGKSRKIMVPLPQITLPRFIYGEKEGGIGQGSGGGKGAGDTPGENALEVEVTLEEIADLLSEELQLPRIEPKGKSDISVESKKYRSIRTTGPESLRHFKKTFSQALKRSISEGAYDPDNPVIYPVREDKRYRSSKPVKTPRYQAVIFYIMDVSGSMGEEEKKLARLTSFWIDVWLRRNYDFLKSRYIIHNYNAVEVDQNTFYHTSEGGGTRIASAYELAKDIIRTDYYPAEWNIYIFQYSDGDDWGGMSQAACNHIDDLSKIVNQIAYCQVNDRGSFKKIFDGRFHNHESVISTSVYRNEGVLEAIKELFTTGS